MRKALWEEEEEDRVPTGLLPSPTPSSKSSHSSLEAEAEAEEEEEEEGGAAEKVTLGRLPASWPPLRGGSA
jgi:hypothetical protein